MTEYSFNAEFNEIVRTFEVSFKDLITLYRGVERVWIGDGSGGQYNENGILYAEMIDGVIQTLGPVTSYYYALQSGFAGTFNEWVQVILDGTVNAQRAETAASEASASATSAASSKSSASSYATTAAKWATGSTSGTPSATNNAKYFAEYMDERITALGNFLHSATTVYHLHTAGDVPPSDNNWTSSITPEKGKYLWAKTIFSWTDGTPDTIEYIVSYIGQDSDIITNAEIDTLFA